MKSTLFALFATLAGLGAADLSVADFGLNPDGDQNATPLVRTALAALKEGGGGVLRFPKGTYHFHAEGARVSRDGPYVSNNQDDFPKWTAMPIEGMRNVTIDGGGSLFLFHHRMMVFHVVRSEQVILRDLAIDFIRPIHSDSVITEIAADSFTLRFEPEITYRIDDKGTFQFLVDGDLVDDWSTYSFDGETGRSKYQLAQGFRNRLHKSKASEIRPGLVRFDGKVDSRFRVGDRITFRHNNRNHVALLIEESKDTTLKGVTIHHACGMGVVGQRSENISIDRFRMAPRKGAGRISTAMADATHFSGCKGLLSVTNSHFQGMMDDAINVHGTSLRITAIDGPRSITARFMHGQSKGFAIAAPGDEIRLLDNETLLPVGDGFFKVAKVEVLDVNQVRIHFARDLPGALKVNHATENVTWTPEVRFAGNTVVNNRARGMLFNTPRKCVVEGNLVRTAGSAVLVAGDANGWFESGAVGEFGPTIIRGNTFDDCLTSMFQFCRAIISIDPEIRRLDPARAYHRDIRIENNHFKVFDAPLVFVRSTDGLAITGNTIERTKTFPAWHPNKHAFSFQACQRIILRDNTVRGELRSTHIDLQQTPSAELTVPPNSPFQP